MDREKRIYDMSQIEVRAASDDEPARIEGFAAVYNVESNDLGGFVEIIEPGFFRDVLTDDVRSLWNHNSDVVLGRTRAGTLEIYDAAAGLRTVTFPPETQAGRDALVSIERGDVDQMSFAFTVRQGGDRWSVREDGVVERRLLPGGCARLYDISPVTFPAYEETRVSARALEQVNELAQAGQMDEKADEAGDPEGRAAVERRLREIRLLQERLR